MSRLFIYDGSYDGFLTAVFEAYASRSSKDAAFAKNGGELMCPLDGEVTDVVTDREKAWRVRKSLMRLKVEHTVSRAWLSNESGIDGDAFAVIAKSLRDGTSCLGCRYLAFVKNTDDAAARVGLEVERFLQFVRFTKLGGGRRLLNDGKHADEGLYIAEIEPSYDILPLIINHFTSRLRDQRFIIRDKRHGIAALWDTKRLVYSSLPALLNLPLPSDGEFADMWRRYYNRVAIPWRRNLKLQAHFIPARYRRTMTEFKQN